MLRTRYSLALAAGFLCLASCSSVPPAAAPPDAGIADVAAGDAPGSADAAADVAPDACIDCEARTTYPSVHELHGGAQGVYAGCAPNGGVCHNSRQYPNMANLGAFLENIDQPCNLLRDDPKQLDDLCEPEGDYLKVGNVRHRLGYVDALPEAVMTDDVPRHWALTVQDDLPVVEALTPVSLVRLEPANDSGERPELVLYDLRVLGVTTSQQSGQARVLNLALPPPLPPGSDPNTTFDSGAFVSNVFLMAGAAADPYSLQLGDPNRNGTYGYDLGGRLIKPGHPELSYLMHRLTDPAAGPLMPLANCCYWTKPALRALYCWVNGLSADGSNAEDPIDYDTCPPGPDADVVYPDPGPECSAASSCPVQPGGQVPDDPTFSNIYSNVLSRRCAGSGCHFDGDPNGLDMRTKDTAYTNLVDEGRVIPGMPMAGELIRRLTLTCTDGQPCDRMPLGRDPLPDSEIALIQKWIEMGAMND
jgi:hypothetical protein